MSVFQIQINQKVETFLSSLEKKAIAKTLRTIDLLEQFGYRLTMPHTKKVQGDIHELRIRGQQEIRIFYAFGQNKKIFLLHGFIKKSQKIPSKEIKIAQKRAKAFLNHSAT